MCRMCTAEPFVDGNRSNETYAALCIAVPLQLAFQAFVEVGPGGPAEEAFDPFGGRPGARHVATGRLCVRHRKVLPTGERDDPTDRITDRHRNRMPDVDRD